jgi:hypothetical protein
MNSTMRHKLNFEDPDKVILALASAFKERNQTQLLCHLTECASPRIIDALRGDVIDQGGLIVQQNRYFRTALTHIRARCHRGPARDPESRMPAER